MGINVVCWFSTQTKATRSAWDFLVSNLGAKSALSPWATDQGAKINFGLKCFYGKMHLDRDASCI